MVNELPLWSEYNQIRNICNDYILSVYINKVVNDNICNDYKLIKKDARVENFAAQITMVTTTHNLGTLNTLIILHLVGLHK